ncbi:CRISPR-associated protein Cas4 [Methanothrix sp.]|jgi:CRISPR-associated exonuclease Cas4|uniref:CRISPR-associated protein Cas4 n=2 Tax=Methanothrix sp. TaxID=90426 RepID=UPI003BB516B9
MMYPAVRISDIGLYLLCPRLVYFDSLGKLPRFGSAKQVLMRSLALSLLQKDDLEGQLKEALQRLRVELPLVYDLKDDELQAALKEADGEIVSMARGLICWMDQLIPFEAEVELYSEKLGLSGRLDRLAPGDTPSIIRTGRPPENGIWKRDRLMLAGYSLLLGEKENIKVDWGQVEYPSLGMVRRVPVRSTDKARVLRIRDRVRLIKGGQLPDRPEGSPCQSCHAQTMCDMKHSLASKFF